MVNIAAREKHVMFRQAIYRQFGCRLPVIRDCPHLAQTGRSNVELDRPPQRK